jgi:hypothetical protein
VTRVPDYSGGTATVFHRVPKLNPDEMLLSRTRASRLARLERDATMTRAGRTPLERAAPAPATIVMEPSGLIVLQPKPSWSRASETMRAIEADRDRRTSDIVLGGRRTPLASEHFDARR